VCCCVQSWACCAVVSFRSYSVFRAFVRIVLYRARPFHSSCSICFSEWDPGSPLQVTLAMLFSGWAHVLHAVYKPWRVSAKASENATYMVQHASLFVTSFVFLMGLLFKVEGVSGSSATYEALSVIMLLLCIAFVAWWSYEMFSRVVTTAYSRLRHRGGGAKAASDPQSPRTSSSSQRAWQLAPAAGGASENKAGSASIGVEDADSDVGTAAVSGDDCRSDVGAVRGHGLGDSDVEVSESVARPGAAPRCDTVRRAALTSVRRSLAMSSAASSMPSSLPSRCTCGKRKPLPARTRSRLRVTPLAQMVLTTVAAVGSGGLSSETAAFKLAVYFNPRAGPVPTQSGVSTVAVQPPTEVRIVSHVG
jgi:hypothetical protein